eukprot:TRINITY_DN2634_c0_g1_i1.p1 TRINITY_DN2634_c0_g1~~TRINITY_DN2634_c0_g1_i1.p1  ORF type:complete len:615 (+),score=111.83 TRINITY_DN2634_c0_g1_i1:176-2020(+)
MKIGGGQVVRAFAVLAFCSAVLFAAYGIAPTSAFSVKTLQRFEEPASNVKGGLNTDRFEGFDSHLELPRGNKAVANQLKEEEEEVECEEAYGLLPCSLSVGGNIFLLLAYGYLMLKAAQCLSEGSELLLTILDPGLIGGLLLPVLGCLPDAILIAVSGLSASQDNAAEEVLVGMGLLAGSTVMLLTLLWGSSLIVGRCDLEVNPRHGLLVAKDRTLTRPFDLLKTGVTVDYQTRVASWIMVVTVLPYLIAQSPRIFGWSTAGNAAVLIGGVVALLGLAVYCAYQVFAPWIQARRQIWARERYIRTHAVHKLHLLSQENKWGNILLEDNSPNPAVFEKLFDHFDADNNHLLSVKELKALIVGISFEHEGSVPSEEVVSSWMSQFDLSKDGNISEEEFMSGMSRWLKVVSGKKAADSQPHNTLWKEEDKSARNALAMLDESDEDEEGEKGDEGPSRTHIITKAVLLIAFGALIAGLFADPLVDAITNFSSAANISPFFISFIFTPLATNSSEAISSILFAKGKRKRNISMTYSQVYGGVTMNNTLCLGIFLAVVYVRGLVWDFSSEVTVILFATCAIGLLASFRTTFPLWTGLVALAIYPIAIALVAVLDSVLGWQ